MNVCPDSISWTIQPFVTKLCVLVLVGVLNTSQPPGIISWVKTKLNPSLSYCAHKSFNTNYRYNISMAQLRYYHISIIMSWSVLQKTCFAIFKVKVTASAYIIKIRLFLLYLINLWSVCNWTWFDGTSSEVGMSCKKLECCVQGQSYSKGLKCQQNVCPDNICWTIQPFIAKLEWCCITMSLSVMWKKWFAFFKVKVTARAYLIWIWLFLFYWVIWTADPFAAKLGLMA